MLTLFDVAISDRRTTAKTKVASTVQVRKMDHEAKKQLSG